MEVSIVDEWLAEVEDILEEIELEKLESEEK